jgi:hypothetical protein
MCSERLLLLFLLIHNPAIQLFDKFLQFRGTVGDFLFGIVQASVEDIVEDIGLYGLNIAKLLYAATYGYRQALIGVLTAAFRGTLPKMGLWLVLTEASVSRTLARGGVPNFA